MADVGVASPFDALAALERFVVDNDDLLDLESRIGTFNIFDALHIARQEIRHSNFLAFLLDPGESHGQSALFLRALLMDLLKSAAPDLRPLSPIEIDGAEFRGVDVRREWRHIDLLIACESPELLVVVENKVDSGEGKGQLAKYRQTIRQAYPGARPLLVFLTPTGTAPSEEGWVPYSYADLHRVFARIRASHQASIGDDVRVFLDHYLNLIGTRFMNDPQIDELCQRIYKNHRLALQLIYDRAGSPASGPISEVEAAVRADERWHVFYRIGSLVDFVPATWLDWMPALRADGEAKQAWFVLRFEAKRRLGFLALVQRMSDQSLRKKVVEALLKRGKDYGLNRKQSEVRPSEHFTRVSSREVLMQWPEDSPPEPEQIAARVRQKLDDLYPKLKGLPDDLLIPIVKGK